MVATSEEQRQTFRLGPRSTRGLFGYITATQGIAAGGGAVIAIGLLAGSHSVLVLVVAIVDRGGGCGGGVLAGREPDGGAVGAGASRVRGSGGERRGAVELSGGRAGCDGR